MILHSTAVCMEHDVTSVAVTYLCVRFVRSLFLRTALLSQLSRLANPTLLELVTQRTLVSPLNRGRSIQYSSINSMYAVRILYYPFRCLVRFFVRKGCVIFCFRVPARCGSN